LLDLCGHIQAYATGRALVPKMSVAETTVEHMNEYITPVVTPGTDPHRHQLDLHRPGTGRTLAPAGPLPGSTGPASDLHDADITAGTIQQAAGERMDLHFAIWVALHNGRTAQDRHDHDRYDHRYDHDRQAA
jgi:hypothetical protein